MRKNKLFKRAMYITAICCALPIIIMLICYFIVAADASGRTFDSVSEVPHNKIGLLLATSPITPDSTHNFYFDNRIKNTLREYPAHPKMFLDFPTGIESNIKPDTLALPNEHFNDSDVMYINSVKGHKEEDFIVGNFTGSGIDTIFISDTPRRKLSKKERKRLGFGLVAGDDAEDYRISYAVSNNPDIPPVELFWPNGLVLEGDVDGDGKDEWGYLYQWTTSQWRLYRIYNYDSKAKTWRHLYYGDLLDTPKYVRESGVDIVEKGPHPGFIKINYGTWGVECELRDTIVKPTYTKISEDAW